MTDHRAAWDAFRERVGEVPDHWRVVFDVLEGAGEEPPSLAWHADDPEEPGNVWFVDDGAPVEFSQKTYAADIGIPVPAISMEIR